MTVFPEEMAIRFGWLEMWWPTHGKVVRSIGARQDNKKEGMNLLNQIKT
jgi:hypothetical protein